MTDAKTLKRKSVRGAISYGVRTLALQGIAFVAQLFLGVYLSPEEFGIYFIVTSIVGMFIFLSDVGLAAALVQKKTEPTLDELRTTFTVQQMLAVGITVIIVSLSQVWVSRGLNQAGLWLLYSLAFSFVLSSLKTIPSILLERKLEFGKLVIPQIAENLVFYGVVVFLASKHYGITSYIYAILLRSVAGIIVLYSIQRWSIGFKLSKDALRGLFAFGAKFQLNDVLARIKDDLFIVVIAKFISPQNMGYLSWAKRWSMFPYQLTVSSVMSVTFPTFSRLQHDPKLLRKAIEKSVFFVTLIIFPLLAGLTGLAKPLLHVFPQYEKWLPAVPALWFFSINVAWAAISSPLTNTLNAIGNINATLKLMIMWTVLTWICSPLAVYFFGFTGVAIASAVIGFSSILTVAMLKSYVQVSLFHSVWRQALAALCMTAVLGIWGSVWSKSLVFLAVGAALAGTTYLLVLALVGFKMIRTEVTSLLG